MGAACSMYGERQKYNWLGDTKKREHSEDLGIYGKIILKWIFKKLDGDVWTGLSWLKVGTGDGRL